MLRADLANSRDSKQMRQRLIDAVLLGCIGLSDDMAEVVLALAGPMHSLVQ